MAENKEINGVTAMTVKDFTITLEDKKGKAKWTIPHYHKHTLEMILDKLGINTDLISMLQIERERR